MMNATPKHNEQRQPSTTMSGQSGFTNVKEEQSKDNAEELQAEKQAKAHRENQEILIYIFVSVVIAISWIFGIFEFSFLWVFGLIVLTFIIWWGKVMSLTEDHIKYQEILVHRKRALRHSETTEWLNFIINRWWVFSSSSISDLFKKNLDPLLNTVRPAFIENIELYSFTAGENTPYIKFLKVYECTDGAMGGRKPLSWLSATQPPPGLPRFQQYQMVLEGDVGLQSEDFKMVFRTRLGGKWMGMNMDVAVEKLNVSGRMQLVVNMDMDSAFPHISTVTVSFIEKMKLSERYLMNMGTCEVPPWKFHHSSKKLPKLLRVGEKKSRPEVWFNIRLLKAVQMMEIPLLKSWIHSLVMDGLTQALVDPGKIDIKVESSGPTYAPARARSKSRAKGVLTVTVSSEQAKGGMFPDDVRYCVLRVGDQRMYTQQTQGSSAWQDTCSFLVEDLRTDRLVIKSKSKRLLSTYTLAQFEVMLADYPLEHKQIVEACVEEKVSKWQAGGVVRLDLAMEYALLPSTEDLIEKEAQKPNEPVNEVAGVMYVCVHCGNNLLALDRNGTSDPYCIIFSNGKKIKTTHYVCRTRNPTWEVNTEFVVGDFTRTMLSFLVYDWDGHHANEDDFLGSAYIVLTQEEPRVIKKNLTLGYNLLNVGQVDNLKLGSITVTALFRPVAAVAKSEIHSIDRDMVFQEHQAAGKNKNFMSQAKHKIVGTGHKKSADSMGVGDLLSMGHGILELNIMRARELVAMDSNGFSDPFCEVRIGNERKFTTSIKKKTLNPVWDEWVTTQLPKAHEVLEVVVWDRDPFFKKDFLGSVSFNLDELKKYSRRETDGWYDLQRIRSGSVQLRFKVISEDMSAQDCDVQMPGSFGSESTSDSGLPRSNSSSPRDDDPPHTPTRPGRHRSGSEGVSMSPIREVRSECKVAVNGNMPPESDEVFRKSSSPEEQVLSSQAGGENQHLVPMSQTPNMRTSKKRFSFRLKRSASDANLKVAGKSRQVGGSVKDKHLSAPGDSSNLIKTDSLPANLHRRSRSHHALENSSLADSEGDLRSAPSTVSLYPGEKFYGVQGQVIRGRGLHGVSGPVYCKLRIDNRTVEQRAARQSSGRVICKSASVDTDVEPGFNLSFDIDKGRGVGKEALLIFDLKSSSRKHVATRGLSLQQLLGDAAESTKWVTIDSTIQLEVFISQSSSPTATQQQKSKMGLFRTRSKKLKQKEL